MGFFKGDPERAAEYAREQEQKRLEAVKSKLPAKDGKSHAIFSSGPSINDFEYHLQCVQDNGFEVIDTYPTTGGVGEVGGITNGYVLIIK